MSPLQGKEMEIGETHNHVFRSQLPREHLGFEGRELYICDSDHSCGSLKKEIQPCIIIIIDQFFNRISTRSQLLYDGSHSYARGIFHIPMTKLQSKSSLHRKC
jgi:hypothetical protein